MTLALGDLAPFFSLKSTSGSVRNLEDYHDAEILVLVQASNHCPYMQASQDTLKEIQTEYGPRHVQLVAINSNSAELQPEDSFELMVERAQQEGYNFDYLHDEDQSVARALGAVRTPEVFVFDRQRRLAYHGAPQSILLDHRALESDEGETQSEQYLRDALDALLADRRPRVTETPLLGCSVKSNDLIMHRDPLRFEWRGRGETTRERSADRT